MPRPIVTALFGLIVGFSFYEFLRYLLKKLKISAKQKQFTCHGFKHGSLYGLIAFVFSFAIFIIPNWPDHGFLKIDLITFGSKILFEIKPAFLEEVAFRFGLAFFALQFYGRIGALVAGSIPFGILHLLNFIAGEPIQWDYIVGTSIAGLFLTAIFLRFNLSAAIATHFTWNVFASLSSICLAYNSQNLEGAVSTLIVLLLLSSLLLAQLKKG